LPGERPLLQDRLPARVLAHEVLERHTGSGRELR
jgi:hypothetical protein